MPARWPNSSASAVATAWPEPQQVDQQLGGVPGAVPAHVHDPPGAGENL